VITSKIWDFVKELREFRDVETGEKILTRMERGGANVAMWFGLENCCNNFWQNLNMLYPLYLKLDRKDRNGKGL